MKDQVITCDGIFLRVGFWWCEIKAKSAKIREYVAGFMGLGGFIGCCQEGVLLI